MSFSRDVGQMVLLVGVLLAVIVGAGWYYTVKEPSEVEQSAQFARTFFHTVDQGLHENAWMALHESTRERVPWEQFQSVVQEHPLFQQFSTFEPREGQEDPQNVEGYLTAGDSQFLILVQFQNEGNYPKVKDILLDGRSVLETGAQGK